MTKKRKNNNRRDLAAENIALSSRIDMLQEDAALNVSMREVLSDLVEGVRGLLKDEGDDFAVARLVRALRAAEEVLEVELGKRVRGKPVRGRGRI